VDKLFIIGNGRHASEVFNYIQELNEYEFGGYIVDDKYFVSSLKDTQSLSNFINSNVDGAFKMIGALASSNRKIIIQKLERKGFKFITIIHPTAYLSKTAQLEEGICVAPMSIINVNVQIGAHSIINSNCNISHDCVLGKYTTLSPSATLAGGVILEDGVFVGAGATILPDVKIGENAIIGAGACVTSDVPSNCTVVGVPAKIIKTNFT